MRPPKYQSPPPPPPPRAYRTSPRRWRYVFFTSGQWRDCFYQFQIFFYCERAADEGKGGETAIADVREIYRNLDKSLIEKLNDLGVRYHRFQATENSSKFKSWQQVRTGIWPHYRLDVNWAF